MEENRKHIDDLFKKELGNYTEMPPADLWSSLDKRLDNAPKPGKPNTWVWYIIAALVVGTILYFVINNMATEKNESNEEEKTEETSTISAPLNAPLTNDNSHEIDNAKKNAIDSSIATDKTQSGNTLNNSTENKDKLTGTGKTGDNAANALPNKTSGNSDNRNTDRSTARKSSQSQRKNNNNFNSANNRSAQTTSKTNADKTGVNKGNSRNTRGKKDAAIAEQQKNNNDKADTGIVDNNDVASATSKQPVKKTSAKKAGNAGSTKQNANNENSSKGDDNSLAENINKPSDNRNTKNTQNKKAQSSKSKTRNATDNSNDEFVANATRPNQKTNKRSNARNTADNTSQSGDSTVTSSNNPETSSGLASSSNKPSANKKSNTRKNNSSVKSADDGLSGQFAKAPGNKKANNQQKNNDNITPGANTSSSKPSAETTKKQGTGQKTNSKDDKNNTTAGNNTSLPKNNKDDNSANKKSQQAEDNQPVTSLPPEVPKNETGTNKKEKVETPKDELAYQKGFKAADREEGGIKVSDYMSSAADDAGGNADEDKKQDEPARQVAKGGGGGGGAEEEKQKKKKKGSFDYGIKAGYEMGFGSYKANKVAISPYVQYYLAKNISLVAQPTVKYAMLNKTDLSGENSYYRKGITTLDSAHILVPNPDTMLPDQIIRRYYYNGRYDSVVVKKSIAQKRYWEIEIPLLLQYDITKQLSLFFGGSVNISKVVEVKDEIAEYNGLTLRDSIIFPLAYEPEPGPVVPSADNRFNYTGTPFSQYSNNSQNATTNPMRVTLMFGINYHVTPRFSFNVLLQQTVSNTNYIPNNSIRDIYKQSYIRAGIGIRLGK